MHFLLGKYTNFSYNTNMFRQPRAPLLHTTAYSIATYQQGIKYNLLVLPASCCNFMKHIFNLTDFGHETTQKKLMRIVRELERTGPCRLRKFLRTSAKSLQHEAKQQ